jgi:hypothetical protein
MDITSTKEEYVSPSCGSYEVKSERVIAASVPDFEDGGSLN